jgi:hypothetical protein
MYKLPPRYRTAQARPYDLVTAAYVLGEIRSDVERRHVPLHACRRRRLLLPAAAYVLLACWSLRPTPRVCL